MIKKLFYIFFGCFFAFHAFALTEGVVVGDVGSTSIRVRLPIVAVQTVVSRDAMLAKAADKIIGEFGTMVANSPDGKISTNDMWIICKNTSKITGLNSLSLCYEHFIIPVVTEAKYVIYFNSCLESINMPSGTAHCVDDVFVKEYKVQKNGQTITKKSAKPYAQDVEVPDYTGYGLAIEYLKSQGVANAFCSPNHINDYITCSQEDNSNFYTFKFAGLKNTKDSKVVENTVRGICALESVEYVGSGCLFDSMRDASTPWKCRPGCKDSQCAAYVYTDNPVRNVGDRFNLHNTWYDGACRMWRDTRYGNGVNANEKLRVYSDEFAYMSTAFANIQVRFDNALIDVLKTYVKVQGIDFKSFDCKYGTQEYLASATSVDHDDIMTCVIDGRTVDFVFDDLYENRDRAVENGQSGTQCLLMGAKRFDGKHCKGIERDQCTTLGSQIPGGTRWDDKVDACVLNNAANAQYLRDALWTIGGIIVTAAVVIGTGGTAAIGLAVVLAGGDVALQATFDIVQRTEETKPYRTVKAFLDKVKECQIDSRNLPQVCTSVQRQCAYNTVQDFYATLMQFQEDLPDTTISQMTDAYRTVEHCTTDEDLEFAYNAAVKDVDKASFSVGGLVMMGSFLLSFRNPERTISQLAKTTKLLKRINVKPVERVSSTLGGRKYYRIYINGSGGTLSINEIDNIISELKSKGLYVSSGTETGTGKKFLAFSNKNVFKPWEDNVGNWRFAVQHEGIEIVSASREQFVERLKRYTGYDFEYRTVADDEFARMYGNYYRLKIDNLGYDEVNNIRSKLGETGVKSANIQNNLFLVIYENNMDVFRPNLKAIASERFDQYLAAALAPEPKFYMLPKSRLNDQEWDQLNVMIRKQGVGFVETSQNGTAYMIFRRVTPDADDSWIFSNIYNGMPEEILNQKLSYVVRVAQVSGDDPEAIVDALRYIKAFDEQKASVFIQDLANDIVRRINNMDSNIVERMRNWQKLNKTEREDLVLELHEIVTTERRDRVGNTIIEFDTGSQGVNGAHRVPYGDDPRLFKYRVMRDNFGDVLNTIIHENVHAFQSVGTSTINEYFVNWAKRVYSNDANSRLYWESILEKESSYIGQQTSYSILRQLGLL